MKLVEIYAAMHQARLTKSQMEFSTIWLGRSPRYYSYLLATQREPGLATLCGIAWRLEQFLENMSADHADELLELKRSINVDIAHRSIVDVRGRKFR
ncbi:MULTISPECIES: DUF6626 family protein [Brucella/Ochrobactrum group]|jgi:hypothetical protein|uniref:DUF6626 family protein n=1 Tax=Brucella/Ochrobactrum group TaxID=2826938 RepID=UPI000DDB2784|nr:MULTISPECIES: DUF6626 family protein [Brucella/Ochrobactrum group]MBQ0710968.1 hypothetical protein [Ochrobactrum sp. AP1BH01-1]MBR7651981.1 hypothetical protein [Brucella oryzae]